MNRLVFGCGYLGCRVAALWFEAGDVVHCVTRHEQRAADFARRGWRPMVADVTRAASLTGLPVADTVLFAVARGRQSDESIQRLYVDGLRAVLDALPPSAGDVILISSTGVYGQDDGRWVDESSECHPERAGGQACLAAEQLLADHPRGQAATVLRLAGLYGPGRVPLRSDIEAGHDVADPGEGYLNLIHVDDAAAAVVAAARWQAGGGTSDPAARRFRTYNVSDGEPVSRREYLCEVARRLGVPRPNFVAPAAGSRLSDRIAKSKRVSNRRMIEELGLALGYPSYREGLRAILSAGD